MARVCHTDKEALKGVIDHFEGDLVVISISDDAEPQNIPRKLLPRHAKEGDYLQLEIEDRNLIQAKVDPATTQAAKERIKDKMERLRQGEHLRDDD